MQQDDPEKMARMRGWLELVETELDLDAALVTDVEAELLELISVVAHGPSRPGAPLTAFLVGVAVGRGADGHSTIDRVRELAAAQPAEEWRPT